LIITDELTRTLGLAAKRGVDVRIITPGIPDKKTVYAVTRSYYAGLARQGVRIFEYSPGFCHAKQCVCDDSSAMIGTSNLDYRSLYLHFENDVFLYDCPAVGDMAKDFREMFPQCREVTEKYRTGRSGILRMWQCILRLFAPML
jgi:cardiolipin synthase